MTSLFRLIKENSSIRDWHWLRMPGKEFSELIQPFAGGGCLLKEFSSPLSSVARIFLKTTQPELLIVAEPEPVSPSPFNYNGDRLTVGFVENPAVVKTAASILSINPGDLKSNTDSEADCSEAIRCLLSYALRLSEGALLRKCLQAVQPDPRLEKEGTELFECLTAKLQTVFNADYLEIQLLDPSTFWSDRSESWSWIHSSSSDFQWPVTVSSEQEWDLYRTERMMIIDEITASTGITIAEKPGGQRLNSGILIPLIYRSRKLGILKLFFARQFIHTDIEAQVLDQFQDGISRLFDRTGAYLRAQRMAMIDGLTDLYNQRFFHMQLRTEFQRGLRYHSPMTLIMIDIDDFKLYNDSYGHQAGNKVLTWVARKIRSSVRDIDFVARYGGEEFALILPEIKAEDGLIVAEKIRKAVSSEIVVSDTGERLRPITVSCGVTDNRKAHRPEEMIEQADQALYWVKRHGRNLVRLAETNS